MEGVEKGVRFIPCREDASSARRHASEAQNILHTVVRGVCKAKRMVCTHDHQRGSTLGCVEPHTTLMGVLQAGYMTLLRNRSLVSEAAKKMWVETAFTLLAELCRDEEVFCWFLDSHKDSLSSSPCPSTDTLARHRWLLWEDRQRRIHFLTLRTATVNRPVNGALTALRPADLTRMDGSSFGTRVRAWLRCGDIPESVLAHSRVGEEDEVEDVLKRVVHGKYGHLLAGAIRYRMLLEVCVVRLDSGGSHCPFTWRLLVNCMDYLLRRYTAGITEKNELIPGTSQSEVRLVARAHTFVLQYVVPYLEHRGRYAEAMRESASTNRLQPFEGVESGMWATTLDSGDDNGQSLLARVLGIPGTTVLATDGLWNILSMKQRGHVAVLLVEALQHLCCYADEKPSCVDEETAIDAVLRFDMEDVPVQPTSEAAAVEGGDNHSSPEGSMLTQLNEYLFRSSRLRRERFEEFVSLYFFNSPVCVLGRNPNRHRDIHMHPLKEAPRHL